MCYTATKTVSVNANVELNITTIWSSSLCRLTHCLPLLCSIKERYINTNNFRKTKCREFTSLLYICYLNHLHFCRLFIFFSYCAGLNMFNKSLSISFMHNSKYLNMHIKRRVIGSIQLQTNLMPKKERKEIKTQEYPMVESQSLSVCTHMTKQKWKYSFLVRIYFKAFLYNSNDSFHLV